MTASFKALCATLTVLLFPFSAYADEVSDAVNGIASGLVERLPMDQKIALKSLSPDETGLPEDFLRRLTSDLEAALLVASGFEINLANRATMEDVWQEAIEFNNADFGELYQSADADVMLMMAPRAVANGVEVALTAYSLTGDNVGQILASSGTVLLPIDLQQSLGVNVNDLNQQMAEVLQEIERVGEIGGLITNPNTYAEFYHNARVLQQRGEVDLAMRNYEQALAEGYLFVDPLLDLLDLANARYGEVGTQQYFENRLKENLPEELIQVGVAVLGADLVTFVQPILDGEITFAPFLAIWLQATFNDWNRFDTLMIGKARTIADELISEDYSSGRFQAFYIDKIRGATVGQQASQLWDSMMSTQMMLDWSTTSRTSTYFQRVGPNDRRPYMRGFDIQDRVDLNEPIEFCAKTFGADVPECRIISADLNVFTNPDTQWFGFNHGSAMDWTFGMHCAVSVSYTDLNGFRVTSPVLVNHEQREEYAPQDIDKVIECAGDYYRPRS